MKSILSIFIENKRILEIGHRDGEDSFRIEEFNPSEYVLIDLPDKEEINLKWLGNLKSNHKFMKDIACELSINYRKVLRILKNPVEYMNK